MRTFAKALALVLFLSGIALNEGQMAQYEKAVAAIPDVEEIIVYVGATGTKYHRENCRTLRNGAYPMPLRDALNEGREPCKVCEPSV